MHSGLLIVYAGYPVETLSVHLNSEISFGNQRNGNSSRTARKTSEEASYSDLLGRFEQSKSLKRYDFDYKVADGRGSMHYHKEEADGKGTVRGTYGYINMQGLYRTVDYVADSSGYHAKIRTNEPGTGGKNPAFIEMVAEQTPPVFRENYAEPVGIQQEKRIRGENQHEQGRETFNKGIEPPLEYIAPRTMFAVVHQSYDSSSLSGNIPDEEDDEF